MNKLFELTSKYIHPSNPATGTLGSVDYNIAMIQWSGTPLLGSSPKSRKMMIFWCIYGAVIMTFVTFGYVGLEIYDVVLSWGNLNDITQNTCLSLTHIAGGIKMMNAFYHRKDILRIIEQLRSMAKKYVVSKEQKKTFFQGEFENKMLLTIYATVVGFTALHGLCTVMLNPLNIAGKVFPYRVTMPDFIPYSIQVPYMGIAVSICAMQIVGIDYLNVNLINQTRYQMKILNIAFDRLAITGEVDFDTNKYLNSLVEHHNYILDLGRQIEKVLKFPLLLQFLTSVVIFAMTGFQATVQCDSQIIILIYFYCGCIFLELFVYCWFGNEVSEQNKTLASRGYNSSWYDFDQKYCKSLLIFLINAQRPFYFTAGGFIELSLVTFSGILSKSYTYLAVLRQLYAEK